MNACAWQEGLAGVASAAVALDGMVSSNCGKGLVARELQLTHFIDDRAECLHSVFFEGWLAVPSAEGGLAAEGLGEAPAHGAMLHFGPDVGSKSIAKAATSDTDLLKLMPPGSMSSSKKPKKPKVAQESAEELWAGMDAELRRKWSDLSAIKESAPAKPQKGERPSPEAIAAMKAHGLREKELKATLSKPGLGLFKRYEKALKQPHPKPTPAVAAGGGGGDEMGQQGGEGRKKAGAPPRAKWINMDAPTFWAQRRACDHLCLDWVGVARLFELAMDTPPKVSTCVAAADPPVAEVVAGGAAAAAMVVDGDDEQPAAV